MRSTGPRASLAVIAPTRAGPSSSGIGAHLPGKLEAQGRAKMIDAKAAEVFVEIPQRWRQRERLDASRPRPFSQDRNCEVAGRIIIAHQV